MNCPHNSDPIASLTNQVRETTLTFVSPRDPQFVTLARRVQTYFPILRNFSQISADMENVGHEKLSDNVDGTSEPNTQGAFMLK
jgi:hypothetical protein